MNFFQKTIGWLGRRELLNWLPDEPFVKLMYWKHFGKRLDLENPQGYNEKLQWLKLYDHNPLYPKLVDKIEAKSYVAERIGEKYIIPTLGIWDHFEDIDFSSLPNSFVLKCTHDSGGLVICTDKGKFNIEEARKKINKSLSRNYYYQGREWPYKSLKPRIIAEEYIEYPDKRPLDDYKMMCFDGVFDNVMVCEGRNTPRGVRFYHFDRDWNFLPYVFYPDIDDSLFEKLRPQNYEEMIEIAGKLCTGFPQIRVDLYNIEGKIYFGELTFFQSGGFDNDYTEEAKQILGAKIKLPDMKQR